MAQLVEVDGNVASVLKQRMFSTMSCSRHTLLSIHSVLIIVF